MCQGLGRNLTWDWRLGWWGCRGCGRKQIPKLRSSLLWLYTCILFGSMLLIVVDCLASSNICSLSPSSAWTEWEQGRGNGGKEPPACMRKAGKKDSLLGGSQGLKLLLNTTWAEGNTKDKDHAHRHEKSQCGIFLRVGAVEAAILYILVCGYFKRRSIWEVLCFSPPLLLFRVVFGYCKRCIYEASSKCILVHSCSEL